MKADLSRCLQRLDGAEEDFETLKAELLAAIKAHGNEPVHFTLKDHPKLARGHKVGVISVDSSMEFPRVWDRRAAHILYDVRSSLDHLVHELYVASCGKRPLKNVAGRLQFPICDSKGAWAVALQSSPKRPSNVEGLDQRFLSIIRRHQPFVSKAKARHVLSQLRRFSDLDKHRRPNVVLFAAEQAQIGIELPDYPAAEIEIDPVGMRRALKVGTEVALIRITSRTPIQASQVRVNMKVVGSLLPSLARGVRLEILLNYAILEARSIIKECQTVL